MSKVTEILRQLEAAHFWGKLEIEIRNGEIAVLRKSETLKVENPRMEKNHDGRYQTSR